MSALPLVTAQAAATPILLWDQAVAGGDGLNLVTRRMKLGVAEPTSRFNNVEDVERCLEVTKRLV